MCYSPLHCLTEISPLQLQVMRNTFLANISFFDTLCGPATALSPPVLSAPSILYPNPASQEVQLVPGSIGEAAGRDMTIQVFDGMGSVKIQIQKGASRQVQALDLNGLSPGMYWVRISTPEHQEVLKLTLLK